MELLNLNGKKYYFNDVEWVEWERNWHAIDCSLPRTLTAEEIAEKKLLDKLPHPAFMPRKLTDKAIDDFIKLIKKYV